MRPNLPEELLGEILQDASPTTLLSAASSCKRLHGASVRHLYKRVTLDASRDVQLRRFRGTVDANRKLAALVRSMTLLPTFDETRDLSLAFSILRKLPCLRAIELQLPCTSALEQLNLWVEEACRQNPTEGITKYM